MKFSEIFKENSMNYEMVIKERFQNLIDTYIAYVLGNREGEIIHDFRVCIRRNHVVFYALEDKKTAKRLKKYLGILGEIRDLEVQDVIFRDEFPEERDIRNIISFEKQRKSKKLEKKIWNWKIDKIEYKYDENLFKKNLEENINKYKKDLKKALYKYQRDNSLFHKARIKLKKYRYTIEIAAIENPEYLSELEELKAMQELMGDLQDYSITRKLLRKFEVYHYETQMIEKRKKINIKLMEKVTIFLQNYAEN